MMHSKDENHVLIGICGSGKSTIAWKLASEGFYPIYTGNLLQNEISINSVHGKTIEQCARKRLVVNDEIIVDIMGKYFEDLHKFSFVIDSFPVTLTQYNYLKSVLTNLNINKKTNFVYVKVDLKKTLQAKIHRRTCNDCGTIFNLISRPPKDKEKCDDCNGGLFCRFVDTTEMYQSV